MGLVAGEANGEGEVFPIKNLVVRSDDPDEKSETCIAVAGGGPAGGGGAGRRVGGAQRAMGLLTFFTIGEPEGRAWAMAKGSTALDAAGLIHTDISRGFIRTEVIGWDELLECGSLPEARKRGMLRTEGKQYIVQDGDTMLMLFNV